MHISARVSVRMRGIEAGRPRTPTNFPALEQPQVQVVELGFLAIKARSLLFLYTAGAHKFLLSGDSCFKNNGVTDGAPTHDIGSHAVLIRLVKSDS